MTGLIDVGGGQRGIYGAGVEDRCLDDGIYFDCCIGVSAGGANIVSFLGDQKGRNYDFYRNYANRRQYMSFFNLIKKGSYIDLDYIYGTLSESGGENPLDYNKLARYKGKLNIVATDAADGSPVYFSTNDIRQDDYHILNASSCLPVMCRPVRIGDRSYYDGGISDPIPIDRAFSLGVDKLVIVLTRSENFIMDGKFENIAARLLEKHSPGLAAALRRRPELYNGGVEKAKRLEKEGKCLIIAPENTDGAGTVTKDAAILDRLYKTGYEDAGKISDYIS